MDFLDDPKPKNRPGTEGRCPLCGGGDFTWGFFTPGLLRFKTEQDNPWVQWTGWGGAEVRARACNGCDNLQLFLRR
jgi:hypothetical protein